MSTHIIELPWSRPPLSLNDRPPASRGAVYSRASLVRRTRNTVLVMAQHTKLPRDVARATVQLHYRPRDSRRRDTDNLVATLKPCCDALVTYGLVPDDTPEFMSKPEPIIHPPDRTKRAANGRTIGALWLEIIIEETP